MKYAQLIFSPTGGTQKVAATITENWDTDIETIDLTDASVDFANTVFQKEDLVLIAVPSYGGRVPGLAVQRLLQIGGGGASCVLACVYGNRAYEDTLVELNDVAEQCGFRVLAAVAAVAEHSIMHQYAAGRPDRHDIEQLHDSSAKILAKFRDVPYAKSAIPIPGNRPYKQAGKVDLVPKAGKNCVSCGLCAAHCPAQAISRQEIRSADSKKCISCMRCVAQCPHKARRINRALVSVASRAMKKVCSVRKECELFIKS